jgi:hypothetical protein
MIEDNIEAFFRFPPADFQGPEEGTDRTGANGRNARAPFVFLGGANAGGVHVRKYRGIGTTLG